MDLILILAALVITTIAHLYLKIVYAKYKKIDVISNYTGYDVATKILEANDLDHISVGRVSGELADHYNNRRQVINLSREIYDGTSIASCAVAAHECGHAIQYKEGYLPIKIRNFLVPFINIGSYIGYIIIGISLASSFTKLFTLGIVLICLSLVFQLLTLPVEFDASRRGNKILIEMGIVDSSEQKGTKSVLRAAAMTYVAGVISSLIQVLRLIMLFTGRGRKK